jgi:hypothetical protein
VGIARSQDAGERRRVGRRPRAHPETRGLHEARQAGSRLRGDGCDEGRVRSATWGPVVRHRPPRSVCGGRHAVRVPSLATRWLPHPRSDSRRMLVERPSNDRPVHATALVLGIAALCVVVVLTLSRLVGPRLLRHYERFPEMAAMPKLTATAKGTPADPLNIALVGNLEELRAAMRLIGWVQADSLSRASDLAIARSVLLNRPDSTAPVSSLFLFGRRQDLAFEQQVGQSARRRHHVRFWLVPALHYDGRPLWIGDASYDASAGLSHRGFHPTHHIAPDIDRRGRSRECAECRGRPLRHRWRAAGRRRAAGERAASRPGRSRRAAARRAQGSSLELAAPPALSNPGDVTSS